MNAAGLPATPPADDANEGLSKAEHAILFDVGLPLRPGGPLAAAVERIVAARESAAATRARAEGAAEALSPTRLLLAKYEGRSKWVGYERARREAWAEIENDLRHLIARSDAAPDTGSES